MKREVILVALLLAVNTISVRLDAASSTSAGEISSPIQLDAKSAQIHGQVARFMLLRNIGNICCWTDERDWVSWQFEVTTPGSYVVELRYSSAPGNAGSTFEVSVGAQHLGGTISADTGSWYRHRRLRVGVLELKKTGQQTLSLKPTGKPGQVVMNLAWVRLIPMRIYAGYAAAVEAAESEASVFVVPNFHPASCGWLTDWSTERNYCANSYLDHLTRVRNDRQFAFVLSEVNNIVAIMHLHPDRVSELKASVREGRTELVNGFFLEPTVNLSGGEALAKMGIEGIRWQQQVMGVRPRSCWMIDICGQHEQMAQIVSQLDLQALVYCRFNPTGSVLHWAESPDGSRVLAICSGHYAQWPSVFRTKEPLGKQQIEDLLTGLRSHIETLPIIAGQADKQVGTAGKTGFSRRYARQPALILAGSGDYSLAPLCATYPSQLLTQLREKAPAIKVQFATLSDYFKHLPAVLKAKDADLPVMRDGTDYGWNAFWVQCPRVKVWYRRCEHALQATEALATIASVESQSAYPTDDLYHAWLLMLLNMDRNTLWGAAGGMVFEDARSWDARDRFQWVEQTTARIQHDALRSLSDSGRQAVVFNPLNWQRTDAIDLRIPEGMCPDSVLCQKVPGGATLCKITQPSVGLAPIRLLAGEVPSPRQVALPKTIETAYYTASVDPETGDLASLKLKPSHREMLAAPGNVIVAEQRVNRQVVTGHTLPPRPERKRIASSGDHASRISVTTGPVATIVNAACSFIDGAILRRTVRFYHDSPRIDFTTELNDIPDGTVVVAEFPLANRIQEVRRGIPFGFSLAVCPQRSDDATRGPKPGVVPVIRWSHYSLENGDGFALLDRGLTGRELDGNTPTLFLLNAVDTYCGYPNAWLSGKGTHRLQYAIMAHEGPFERARIPQVAWEYNALPITCDHVSLAKPKSYIHTSDNAIVQAVRREGKSIEVRLVECLGKAGDVAFRIDLPHHSATITNLLGDHPTPLAGGPTYRFQVRPQQIVTLRFASDTDAGPIKPLTTWEELVPPKKRAALNQVLPSAIGHPPRGD